MDPLIKIFYFICVVVYTSNCMNNKIYDDGIERYVSGAVPAHPQDNFH